MSKDKSKCPPYKFINNSVKWT